LNSSSTGTNRGIWLSSLISVPFAPEPLDHVIVFNEASLCRHLKSFLEYYHQSRIHLSLEKDTPESRWVQPPESGHVVAVPQVGGLHHRYERRAA
jgi:hypothetical protein